MPRPRPLSARRVPTAAVAAAVALFAAPSAPEAHPHVFVEASTSIVFDEDGRIGKVRHAWRFDPFYSTFAIQGFDEDANGILTRAELAPLAEENTSSLAAFDYFSFLYADGTEKAFSGVNERWLEYDPEIRQLTLYFELEVADPVDPFAHEIILDVFDPAYFVDFSMYPERPFSLVDAPAACGMEMEEPPEIDPMTATALAAIPANQDIPEAYRSLTSELSNTAIVTCDGESGR